MTATGEFLLFGNSPVGVRFLRHQFVLPGQMVKQKNGERNFLLGAAEASQSFTLTPRLATVTVSSGGMNGASAVYPSGKPLSIRRREVSVGSERCNCFEVADVVKGPMIGEPSRSCRQFRQFLSLAAAAAPTARLRSIKRALPSKAESFTAGQRRLVGTSVASAVRGRQRAAGSMGCDHQSTESNAANARGHAVIGCRSIARPLLLAVQCI
ncbi:hypothetical protein GGE07_005913 [Sinorhizobium terangae]|nr:hypothetical protein [Sinorhizobium terangae]